MWIKTPIGKVEGSNKLIKTLNINLNLHFQLDLQPNSFP